MGSLLRPGINTNTNLSVIFVILPSMILPSSIFSLDSCEFNSFSNSFFSGDVKSLYTSI